MPTYRAPGVFIEEISSGSRPITPVATSTAAFVGAARKGPVGKATLVTSLAEFEKKFGEPYRVTDTERHYLAYAVRHFFEQGGTRCYVIRVVHYNDPNVATSIQATPADSTANPFAGTAPGGGAVSPAFAVSAISPGVWGQALTIRAIPSSRFALRLQSDVPNAAITQISLAANDEVRVGTLLWIVEEAIGTIQTITNAGVITFGGPLKIPSQPAADFGGPIATAATVFGPGLTYIGKTSQAGAVNVVAGTAPAGVTITPITKVDGTRLQAGDTVRFAVNEARVVVERVSADPAPATIIHFASQTPPAFTVAKSRVYERGFSLQVSATSTPTVVLETHENLSLVNADLPNHVDTRLGPVSGASQLIVAADKSGTADATFVNLETHALGGGNDGLTSLGNADFIGSDLLKTGLRALTPIRDAAILAIPNASDTVIRDAIAYCDRRGDLFLITERPEGFEGTVTNFRNGLSSKYVAIYHPWIEIADPFSPQPLTVPPCGAVAGIYALTDARRGVHKAPAGLDTGKVFVADALQELITKADYDGLYQDEINAILSLRDGFHVWGSRTIASVADEEWRQVSVRRLFNFLEKSIENGTQWVTFEPNDPTLWKSIERNISAFLRIQWLESKLVGTSEKEAFFVRCNAETNPPEVVNAGQVVTIIGAAPSRPAEFVIFRIRQKVGPTAG